MDIKRSVRRRLEGQGVIDARDRWGERGRPSEQSELVVGIMLIVCGLMITSIGGYLDDLLLLGVGLLSGLGGVVAVLLWIWDDALDPDLRVERTDDDE